jgi:hypothetical protein
VLLLSLSEDLHCRALRFQPGSASAPILVSLENSKGTRPAAHVFSHPGLDLSKRAGTRDDETASPAITQAE